LGLAEEQLLPGEEQHIRATIDEIAKFTRENWLPGGNQSRPLLICGVSVLASAL
jgi:hypothetical protein